MFMEKRVWIRKVKIFTIGFVILLVGCAGFGRYHKPRPEPDGFGDIKWGTEISALKDMERVAEGKSSDVDLAWYTRKGDALIIGKAKLEKIFIRFGWGTLRACGLTSRATRISRLSRKNCSNDMERPLSPRN